MDEDAIPSSGTTTVDGSTTVIDTAAGDGTSSIIDAIVGTSAAEHLTDVVAAQSYSNTDSNLPTDSASVVMSSTSNRISPSPTPIIQNLEQQQLGNIMLPSGEEMNCKNTLQSYDLARENHGITEISPDGLPEISVLSLPSDLQTLAQSVIGTPVTPTIAAATNAPPVGLQNDTFTGTTTGTASTTNGIPIHADAVVAVTSIPEAEAFVIHSANENKSPSASMKKLSRLATGVAIILVLVIGIIIGITIPIVAQSSPSSSSSSTSSSKPQDDEDGRSTPQMYIAEYISQYINNITLSNRYLRSIDDTTSTTNIVAEEASLRWLIEDSLNDPDWIGFYERNGKDSYETNEHEPYDPVADLRQHLSLTQKYVLLILWFQQYDSVTMEFAESWTKTDGWLRDADVCMWYGITCEGIDLMTLLNDEDGAGRIDNNTTTDIDTSFSVVTGIDFRRDDDCYSGTGLEDIKDEVLFFLFYAEFVLLVDSISFNGTIPHDMGLLTHLRVINFRGNYIDGSLPSSLSLLSKLGVLDVSENLISGSIPDGIQYLTALTHLDISNNNMHGTIPSSLSRLESMHHFRASSNFLSGTIPEFHWNNIQIFEVSYNRMKGTLPMVVQEWTSLSIFLVMSNTFSGTIPTWIYEFPNMTAFSIARNGFTGTIPSSTQSWDSAKYIDFSSNEIHGTLPFVLADSRNGVLIYFNVTNNKLNGTIPFSDGFCNSLDYFSCERNAFHGPIPDGFKSCASLFMFELSQNKLTGSLPGWIFQSSILSTFLAADNEFTGTFPQGINESVIRDFQVQNNMLAGTLPVYMEQWRFLEVFDVSGNSLTGTIPSQFAASCLSFLTILLQNNSFIGNVSETLCAAATRIEADCDIFCTCCTNCIQKP